ncbi:MAG: hypothetical protein KBS99_09355 [Prevotellaceae bacterium]|nr:hypothetical protein [Candidatus Colivivens caballi]
MKTTNVNAKGNARAPYIPPFVEYYEIENECLLASSTESNVSSNDWIEGSESIGGFGDDDDE